MPFGKVIPSAVNSAYIPTAKITVTIKSRTTVFDESASSNISPVAAITITEEVKKPRIRMHTTQIIQSANAIPRRFNCAPVNGNNFSSFSDFHFIPDTSVDKRERAMPSFAMIPGQYDAFSPICTSR